ncbi:MAG: hypothetical protein SVE93_03640 [Candidatus Thermoplasmatota archaeon]|nr:hypothetical protein [Candidatus Thermoplasmatota archaeon]
MSGGVAVSIALAIVLLAPVVLAQDIKSIVELHGARKCYSGYDRRDM